MSQQASWDYIAKCICLGDSGTGKSSLTIRLCEGRFSARTDTTIGVEFGSRVVPVGPPASNSLQINDPSVDEHTDALLPSAPSSTSNNNSTPCTSTKSPTPSRRSRLQEQQEAQATTAGKNGTNKASPSPHKKQQQQKHMKLSLWDTAGQETYKAITRSYFRGASGALLVFDITRRETFDSVTSWLRDLRAVAEDGIIVVLVGNKADLAPSSTVSSAPDEENRRQITREQAEAWCAGNDVLKYVETSAKSGDGVERAFLEVAERIFQNIQAGKYDLTDRRSGVKSASAAAGNGLASANTINLGVEDVNVSAARSGSCC